MESQVDDTSNEGVVTLTCKHLIGVYPSIPRFIHEVLKEIFGAKVPNFEVWFSKHIEKIPGLKASDRLKSAPENFFLRVHKQSRVGFALKSFLVENKGVLTSLANPDNSPSFDVLVCLGMIMKKTCPPNKVFYTLLCKFKEDAAFMFQLNTVKSLGTASEIFAGVFEHEQCNDRFVTSNADVFFSRCTLYDCCKDHRFWGTDPNFKETAQKKPSENTDALFGDFDPVPRQKKVNHGGSRADNGSVSVVNNKPGAQGSTPSQSKKPKADFGSTHTVTECKKRVVDSSSLATSATKKKQKKKKMVDQPDVEERPPMPQVSVASGAAPVLPLTAQPVVEERAPVPQVTVASGAAPVLPLTAQPAVMPPLAAAPASQGTLNLDIPSMDSHQCRLAEETMMKGFNLYAQTQPMLGYLAEAIMRQLRRESPEEFTRIHGILPPPQIQAPPSDPPQPEIPVSIPVQSQDSIQEKCPVLPDVSEQFESFAAGGEEAHLKGLCNAFKDALNGKIPDESWKKSTEMQISENPDDHLLVFTWRVTNDDPLPPTLQKLAKESKLSIKSNMLKIIIDGFDRSSFLLWIFLTRASKFTGCKNQPYRKCITVLKGMVNYLLPVLNNFGQEYLESGGMFDPMERKFKRLEHMMIFKENASLVLKKEYDHAVQKYCECPGSGPEEYLGLSLARRLAYEDIKKTPGFRAFVERVAFHARAWFERDKSKDPGPILELFFPQGFAAKARVIKENEEPVQQETDIIVHPFDPPPSFNPAAPLSRS